MVAVLGPGDWPVLLCSPIDAEGFVVAGNHFSLDRDLPSDEVLMELPRRKNAIAVLFGSPASGTVIEPDPTDIALTRRLIAAGEKAGIPVDEHILVERNAFRIMRGSLEEA